MSGWRTGRIQIACSIDILRQILINVTPEWEKHIEVDPEGGLEIKTYQTVKKCQVVVRANKQSRQTDIGFWEGEDGKWNMYHMDNSHLRNKILDQN